MTHTQSVPITPQLIEPFLMVPRHLWSINSLIRDSLVYLLDLGLHAIHPRGRLKILGHLIEHHLQAKYVNRSPYMRCINAKSLDEL